MSKTKDKVLLLGLFLILGCKSAFALEIVYPKTNPAKINAPSTFFIGSVKPGAGLKINGIEVKASANGAFAQVVPLAVGSNKFKIISSYLCDLNGGEGEKQEAIDFIITRPQTSATSTTPPMLIEYPVRLSFNVAKDGAPLRMTPVDSGINRMAHLQEGVQLQIDGEKGDFYRVYLNSTLSGWIAKSDVQQSSEPTQIYALKKVLTRQDKDFDYFEFYLCEKPPFVLKEENGITFQVFNVKYNFDPSSLDAAYSWQFKDNTYTLNFPVKKLNGYDIYYDNEKLVLKVRRPFAINQEKPLHDIVIALDAGHGGCEFGAIGGCGDKEKDINLAITKELHKELESRGAKVVMTRTKDEDVAINDRVKFAKEKNAAILVSIHANALPDGADPVKCKGTSVYYYHNQAKALAESILSTMTTQLGTQNDKVRQASLALVRPTASVSVLVEVAYIINPDDYALLLDKNFQAKCAKAIADGISKYLLQN